MSFNVIGKPGVMDKFALQKATGKHDFAADHVLEGLLYTRTLMSPYPHAKITTIDTSDAEKLAGVKAVVTYKDCPYLTQELFYQGQEVASVAATDPHIAAQALELIKVTYQQLPYVLDADQAVQPNSPLTGVVPNSNIIGEPFVFTKGDVTAGFAQADVTVDETVGWSGGFQHAGLEPRSCIAVWDHDLQDKLTVWTTSQNPYGQRAELAAALKLPLHNVTVISHGSGGTFGDRHVAEWCIIAACLAKKAGAPVQYHLSRAENFLTAHHQYPDKAHIKLGAKSDGTLVAIEATFWSDVGAYAMPLVGDAISPLQLTYKSPNVKLTGYSVVTNKPRCAYFRCVGEPGGEFLIEEVIDMLAEKLNMDPVQLRLKNVPQGADKDLATDLPFSSNMMKECIQAAADGIGWTSKWHAKGAKKLTDGRYHGMGINAFICNKGSQFGDVSTVVIITTRDGKFSMLVGHSGIQETPSCQAFIAAEALGVNEPDVVLGDYGNTSTTQDCGFQGGSTRVVTTGPAVIAAANDVKAQVFKYAAPMLNTTPDKLDAKGGKIFLISDPTKFVTYAQVLGDGMTPPIVGVGYTPYDWSKTIRTMVASTVEVAVDADTGDVEVLNAFTADDLGRTIHLMGSEAQIEGGFVQSLGYQLMWEQIVDSTNGVILNPNYLDQKFPTILDTPTPDKFNLKILESNDARGPFGAKGLGEPPLATPAGAIANAIYNAVGVWIRSQPSTPWKILKALGKG
jgi:xanthine dehydrogenase YagR molybdenum-binding subunit